MKPLSAVSILAALALFFVAPCAFADEPPSKSKTEANDTPTETDGEADDATPAFEIPKHRIKYSSLTVLRYNPLGLQSLLDLQYQYKLYDSDSILFRTGYFGIGIAPIVSPGLVRLGVKTEIEPIAVLRLGAKWEYIAHFSNFNLMHSYSDVDGDFS